MTIKELLKDVLGGALGVVGMVVSLVRGGKGAVTTGAAPPLGKSPGREELPMPKGGAEEREAKQLAAKKKKVKKPVATRKVTPAPAAKKGGPTAPAKRAEQVGAAAPAKSAKKAAAAKAKVAAG